MLSILTVCTGNICRSPLAEYLLREDLPPEEFNISSAGIMAVPDGRVPTQQLRIAASIGIGGMEAHRAQMLTKGRLGVSDLILALSRGHRKRIVRMDPQVLRRTFTLREFAYLAGHVRPEDVEVCFPEFPDTLQAAVEAVARMRGMVPPPASNEDFDIVDPFRESRAIYKLSRDQLVPAAETTAAYLNGIVDLFGTGTFEGERREMTEPDIVSQGIPKIPALPKRAELRRRSKFGSLPA